MSRSLNKVMLIGNVGNDPEIRTTQSGQRVANLSIATNRTWMDKAGQKQERADWHRVQVWGKLADVVEKYIHKGDRIYIEGRIEYQSAEKDGKTSYFTNVVAQEIMMLGGGNGERQRPAESRRTENRAEDNAEYGSSMGWPDEEF